MKLNSYKSTLCSVLCLVVAVGASYPSFAQQATEPSNTPVAQQTPPADGVVVSPENGAVSNLSKTNDEAPELKILKSIEAEMKKKKGNDIYERSSVPSLIFKPNQYALLREARIGFNTRAPTSAEIARAGNPNDPNYRPPMTLRDIKLGGIAYNTPDDWTIWLNNSRVTPDALPAEAMDLRVYKDFIEVKWFDSVSNQVFPIRLRMNQRFNLDTHVFLPGV